MAEILTLKSHQRHGDHECISPSLDPELWISVEHSLTLGNQVGSKQHHEKLALHGISMQDSFEQLLLHGSGCQTDIL